MQKMNAEIPIGYYQLKTGDALQFGDMFLFNGKTWTPTELVFMEVPPDTIYIRKEK
jgi:hypothetical protein